jgi:hypothetical protein
MEMAKG